MHNCKHFVWFYSDVSLSNAKEFIDECVMASKFDHPNVLSIFGVSVIAEEDTPLMVMPFMHNGDLKSFVKSKRGDTIKISHFPKVNIATICSINYNKCLIYINN